MKKKLINMGKVLGMIAYITLILIGIIINEKILLKILWTIVGIGLSVIIFFSLFGKEKDYKDKISLKKKYIKTRKYIFLIGLLFTLMGIYLSLGFHKGILWESLKIEYKIMTGTFMYAPGIILCIVGILIVIQSIKANNNKLWNIKKEIFDIFAKESKDFQNLLKTLETIERDLDSFPPFKEIKGEPRIITLSLEAKKKEIEKELEKKEEKIWKQVEDFLNN